MNISIVVGETEEKMRQAAGDIVPTLQIIEGTVRQYSNLRLITSPMMSTIGQLDTGKDGFVALAERIS